MHTTIRAITIRKSVLLGNQVLARRVNERPAVAQLHRRDTIVKTVRLSELIGDGKLARLVHITPVGVSGVVD